MPARFHIRLTVDNLSLSRGAQTLIHDLSLSLGSGDMLWLTGPNGIGKTTLLMALAGLLRPDAGSIRWEQDDQPETAPRCLAYGAHQGVERAGLLLGEELQFWQKAYQDDAALNERLRAVGLEDRETTPVAGLSAGQKRRLSLARLMASRRAAWLMDEPLSGLDTDGQTLVKNTLGQHLSEGGLAIVASHHPVVVEGVEAKKLVLEPAA